MTAEIRHIQTKITASAEGFEATLKGLNKQINDYTKEANRILDSLPERMAAALQAAGQRQVNVQKDTMSKIVRLREELGNREKKLALEAHEYQAMLIRQEADKQKAAISSEIQNRFQAAKLIVQAERVAAAEIAKIHADVAAKRKQEADKAAAAEIAAAERAKHAAIKAASEERQARLRAYEERIAKAKQAAAEESQARQRVAMVGVGAGAVGAVGAAAIGGAVAEYAQFEHTITKIGAVSNSTSGELTRLREAAISAGQATGLGAQQAAEGLNELVLAGFTTEESIRALNSGMLLAKAGGVEVAQAMDLVGGSIRGFGLAAEDAARVSDIMAATANKSAVNIHQIQLAMKYIAPVAQTAGQSIEEMAAAIAIMGNNMIRGEQAGTSMRGALIRLTDPPKEAADALHKLGVSIQDNKGKMLDLGLILEQIRRKVANLTEVQRNQALSQIFGTEALSGMLALINAGAKGYDGMVKQMHAVNGQTKEMADKMNQGLAPALTNAGNALKIASAAFGEQFAPAVQFAAGMVTSSANAFAGMSPTMKAIAAGVATASVALLGIVGTVSAVVLAAGPAVVALAGLGIAVGSISTPFIVAAAGVAILAAGLGGLVVATKMAEDAEYQHKRAIEINTTEAERWNQTLIDSRDRLIELVTEHDNLIDKTNRTTAENERLDAITKILNKEYPQLSGALATAAGGHWAIIGAVRNEIATKEALIRTNIRLAQTQLMAAQAKLGQTKAAYAVNTINAETASQRAGKLGGGHAASAAFGDAERYGSEANRAKQLVKVRSLEVKQYETSIKNMQTQLDKSMESRSVNLPMTKIPNLGAVVPGGSKARKSRGGRRGGSGAGAARRAEAQHNREAREDFKIDEALATERYKQAEETAKRLHAINKAASERELADLQNAKERGRITEEQYIKQVEIIKQKQLGQDRALALNSLAMERQKTAGLLVEAQKAGKVKHTEAVKLAAQLKTLDNQRLSIEADFSDKRKGQAQQTAHAIEAAELARADKLRKFDEDLSASREQIEGDSLKNRLAAIARDYEARERAAERDPELSGKVGEIRNQKVLALENAKHQALRAAQAAYAEAHEENLNGILSKEYDAYVANIKAMVEATDENAPKIMKAITEAYGERVKNATTKFYRGQLEQLEGYVSDTGTLWSKLTDPATSTFDKLKALGSSFFNTFKDQIANALMPTLNQLWVSIGGEGVKAILAMGTAWAKSAIEATAAAVSIAAARIAMGDPLAIAGVAIAGIALVIGAATTALMSEAERQRQAAEAAKDHAVQMQVLNAALSDNIVLRAEANRAEKAREFEKSDPVKKISGEYAQVLKDIADTEKYGRNKETGEFLTPVWFNSYSALLAKKQGIEIKYDEMRKQALGEADNEVAEARQEQMRAIVTAEYDFEIQQAEAAGDKRKAADVRMQQERFEVYLKYQELEKQGVISAEQHKERLEAAYGAIKQKYHEEDLARAEEAAERLDATSESLSALIFERRKADLAMARNAGKLTEAEYLASLNKVEDEEDRSQAERLLKSAEFYNQLSGQAAGNFELQVSYNQRATEAATKAQAIITNMARKARERDEALTNVRFKKVEDDLRRELDLKERAFDDETKIHEKRLKQLDDEMRPLQKQLDLIRDRIRLREEERDKGKRELNKEDKGKFTAALAGMKLGDVDEANLEKLGTLRTSLSDAIANNRTALADQLRQDIGDLRSLTFEGIEVQQKINQNKLELEEVTQEEFTKIAVELALKKAKLAEKELLDEKISTKERAKIQAVLADAYTEWREVQLELLDKQAEAEIRIQDEQARTLEQTLTNKEIEKREVSYALEVIRSKYQDEFKRINDEISANKNKWTDSLNEIKDKTYDTTYYMQLYWGNVASSIQNAINKARELERLQGGGATSVGTGAGDRSAQYGGTAGTRYGVRAMAKGGWVEGGTPGKDSVPVLAQQGEYVTDTSLSAGLVEMVNYFRQLMGDLPRLATANAGGGTYVVNNFKFQDVSIRDERDINLLVDEVSTRIARQY